MENLKHTPGPWTWEKYGDGEYNFLTTQHGKLEIIIGSWVKPHTVDSYPAMYKDGILVPIDKNYPNAKLIAAAPELLEALIEISKGEGPYNEDRMIHAENTIKNMIQLAKEAIKKATE